MAIRAPLATRCLHLLIHGSPRQNLRYFSSPQEISPAILLAKHIFPSPSHLHEFIKKNPFILRTPSSDLSNSISLLRSFGFSQNSLLSIISACPRALDFEYLTKWQKNFFQIGLTEAVRTSAIQMVMAKSGRMGIEPEDFMQSLRRMRGAGLSAGTVIRVFEVLPGAFMSDGIDVGSKIEFLKQEFGIRTQEEINRICYSYPEFLAFNINARLIPLASEISNLRFDRIDIRNLITQNPSLLLGMELGELSHCIKLLEGLNCRAPIKARILARGQLSAAISVKIQIDFLCRHGLIRRDAFKILHVEPRSILYPPKDLEKKMQFLSQKLGFSIDHLVDYPDYLGVNLEKRIAPRLRVINLLRSKGALKMVVELKHFVRMSRREFYNFFVKPYSECEEVFRGLKGDVRLNEGRKKMKHPTGLWNLFKPKRFSDSEVDVRNMKQFMETLV